MKKIILALVILFVSAPAFAGKKDDAWAQCLWKNVPTTTANWLVTKPPVEKARFDAPESTEEMLVYRLRAACERELTPAGKKWPPSLNTKKVKIALEASKPADILPDTVEPKAFRCDYYFENDHEMKTRARFEWGYEESVGRQIWTTTDYGFAGANGGAVYLTKGAGIKKCFIVQSDGSLADA
ncbi:hypothetical protein [Sphingorhabdus sp.]|uniref:hypothetical protein n=1 Tax=Sphingorhabdus sp. TaxID=1902408 RepID=UPI0032B87620